MKQFRPQTADIFRISAPIAFSLLVPQISFVVNTLFVAHLGVFELSVIGIASVYYLLLTWMGYGVNNALLLLLSRHSGASDVKSYRTAVQNGWLIDLGFVLIMGSITFWGFEWIYGHFIHNPEILRGSDSFLKWRLLGFPFLIFNQLINVIFISLGQTMKLLWGSIVGNVVTILLDYLLIFGHGGFQPMGLNGSAIGAAAGELSYCIVMVVFIFISKINERFALFNRISFHLATFREILRLSGPLVFQYIFSIGGWQFFFLLMEKRGNEYVAATQILRNALGLIGIGGWALASTSNTLMGNFIGQNRMDWIGTGLKKLLTIGFLYGASISLLLFLFKDSLIGFYSDDALVVELVMDGIQVIYFSSVIMCMATVLFNAVIGVGKTRISMYFEVTSVLIYCAYLWLFVYVLEKNYTWSWFSEAVYWASLFVFSSFYFNRYIKRNSQSIKVAV